MRFHTHLLASALLGALVYRRSPVKAGLVAIAGVAIDLDHYALYASRSGDMSLLGALRYDRRRGGRPRPGDTRPRYGSLRSAAHRAPLTLPLVWAGARVAPQLLAPVALGLTLHLAMDTPWAMLLDYRIWARSRGRCEQCGSRSRRPRVCHVVLPKRGGDRWAASNRAVLCELCLKRLRKQQGEA